MNVQLPGQERRQEEVGGAVDRQFAAGVAVGRQCRIRVVDGLQERLRQTCPEVCGVMQEVGRQPREGHAIQCLTSLVPPHPLVHKPVKDRCRPGGGYKPKSFRLRRIEK